MQVGGSVDPVRVLVVTSGQVGGSVESVHVIVVNAGQVGGSVDPVGVPLANSGQVDGSVDPVGVPVVNSGEVDGSVDLVGVPLANSGQVDGSVDQGATPGSSSLLRSIPETMYFGGYPGDHAIAGLTNTDFTGCIDEIIMSQRQFDLSKSKETKGTQPGCPAEVRIDNMTCSSLGNMTCSLTT